MKYLMLVLLTAPCLALAGSYEQSERKTQLCSSMGDFAVYAKHNPIESSANIQTHKSAAAAGDRPIFSNLMASVLELGINWEGGEYKLKSMAWARCMDALNR